MTQKGGVMKMGPVGPLEIPPGEEVGLEPGGMHKVLMQLRQALEEGESIPITFTFREAGEITVSAPIASFAARKRRRSDLGKPPIAKDKHRLFETDENAWPAMQSCRS